MISNRFGQMVFTENDVCNHIMQGKSGAFEVDHVINIDEINVLDHMVTVKLHHEPECSVDEFHATNQRNWHMPTHYKDIDIAEYVLSLCNTQAELQRCGSELLMYQDRNLFDLLRYMVYLVDTMKDNDIIWGVGRGSSVASYVLYKIGVHKVDSMYYDLDISEFLR